jgi:hypothetical protein
MIVFLSADDYSNVGNNWVCAMSAMGYDAVHLKTQKSAFAHIQTHTQRCEESEITKTLRDLKATKVVVMHSYHKYIQHIPKGVPYWVMHGGTRYRQNPEHIAEVFKKAEGAIIQTPDLLKLVPGQHETFVPAYVQDPGYIEFNPKSKRFGHFPSNPANKGTSTLKEIFGRMSVPIDIDVMPLPWKENIERIRQRCHVYVELFKPKQGGRTYGTFGVQAVEAALTGRPVITMCANYPMAYGVSRWNYDGLYMVENEEQLEREIVKFTQMSDDMLRYAGVRSRKSALEAFSAERITRALIRAMK